MSVGGRFGVQGEVAAITVGMLLVDVYCAAMQSIEPKKDPDQNYKNVQKAMAKLVKN
jgi:hypothetical protein